MNAKPFLRIIICGLWLISFTYHQDQSEVLRNSGYKIIFYFVIFFSFCSSIHNSKIDASNRKKKIIRVSTNYRWPLLFSYHFLSVVHIWKHYLSNYMPLIWIFDIPLTSTFTAHKRARLWTFAPLAPIHNAGPADELLDGECKRVVAASRLFATAKRCIKIVYCFRLNLHYCMRL